MHVSTSGVAMTSVHVAPPGFAVTTYFVIRKPPVATGGVHETVAWVFP